MKLQAKWMENQCLEMTSNDNTATKIGKEYFGGLFIGLGGIAVISCFILMAEVFVDNWRFRKRISFPKIKYKETQNLA